MNALRKKMSFTALRNIFAGAASAVLFWVVLSKNAVLGATFIFLALSM